MSVTDRAFIRAFAESQPPAGDVPSTMAFAGKEPAAARVTVALQPASRSLPLAGGLKPALEVDRFVWPAECDLIATSSQDDLEYVAGEVVGRARTGSRLVAIACCRPEEGCTTMLLALARQLSGGDGAIGLVDAHFLRPALAQRLGVAAETGFDDVLRGELLVEEAAIRSTEDPLTLLPLCRPVPDAAALATGIRASVAMGQLREYLDLVLMDLGPLLDPTGGGAAMALATECGIDAAILVRDVRVTTDAEILAAQDRLGRAGVATWAVAENFTSGANANQDLALSYL